MAVLGLQSLIWGSSVAFVHRVHDFDPKGATVSTYLRVSLERGTDSTKVMTIEFTHEDDVGALRDLLSASGVQGLITVTNVTRYAQSNEREVSW